MEQWLSKISVFSSMVLHLLMSVSLRSNNVITSLAQQRALSYFDLVSRPLIGRATV